MQLSKFKDNLGEILDYVKESLQKGAEFASEQAPILVEEILTYHTIYYSAMVGVFILLTFVSIFTFKYKARHNRELSGRSLWSKDWEGDKMPSATIIISFILFGVSIAKVIEQMMLLIKVTVAPRLYLLEYARDIINGGGC